MTTPWAAQAPDSALVAGDPGHEDEVVVDIWERNRFLNTYPTVYGYVSVSPRRHVEHVVRDLTVDEYLWLAR
jgi:hypothetical protein